eukprot:g5542.t1
MPCFITTIPIADFHSPPYNACDFMVNTVSGKRSRAAMEDDHPSFDAATTARPTKRPRLQRHDADDNEQTFTAAVNECSDVKPPRTTTTVKFPSVLPKPQERDTATCPSINSAEFLHPRQSQLLSEARSKLETLKAEAEGAVARAQRLRDARDICKDQVKIHKTDISRFEADAAEALRAEREADKRIAAATWSAETKAEVDRGLALEYYHPEFNPKMWNAYVYEHNLALSEGEKARNKAIDDFKSAEASIRESKEFLHGMERCHARMIELLSDAECSAEALGAAAMLAQDEANALAVRIEMEAARAKAEAEAEAERARDEVRQAAAAAAAAVTAQVRPTDSPCPSAVVGGRESTRIKASRLDTLWSVCDVFDELNDVVGIRNDRKHVVNTSKLDTLWAVSDVYDDVGETNVSSNYYYSS